MTKKIISIVLIIATAIFVFYLDLYDGFSHGYFTDAANFNQIYEGDIQGYVDISQEKYSVAFTPIKDHFTGFVLYFANQPNAVAGTICLRVYNSNGIEIDEITIDAPRVCGWDDYKVYTNSSYKKGDYYSVEISAENCVAGTNMILIDNDYITDECADNNLLLGYAYEQSTFSQTEKTLLTMLCLSILLIILSYINKYKTQHIVQGAGVFLLLVTVMSWNYSFNTFGYKNTDFNDFDKYSECLVTTTIKADMEGLYEYIQPGLNGFTDVTGMWNAYDKTFVTDGSWTKGYHNSQSQLLFRTSDYIRDMAIVGNTILFENGDKYPISEVNSDAFWTTVALDSGRPLNWWKHGDLSKVRFIDTDGELLKQGYSFNYTSQYGLQGRMFIRLAKFFDIELLNAIAAIATAVTLTFIAVLIYKKYNTVYAGVFYITFLLSPWIVNFAKNLYWVEFTWFLPMIAGLFCAWKIESKKCRLISYIGAYLAILIKSLCGYEYISVIMMGMISFLLVDFVSSIVKKNKDIASVLFKTIIIMGIIALAGFFTAMCIHAPNKPGADGSILRGIKIIIKNDVMRRTIGRDVNDLEFLPGAEGYAPLASVWETIVSYFHFNTEIISGIDGSLFPIFCSIPILLFAYDIKHKQLDIEMLSMYCVSLLTTMSWFVLAKCHSYVHQHLNYVLWYFGFIQICIYMMVDRIINFCKKGSGKEL